MNKQSTEAAITLSDKGVAQLLGMSVATVRRMASTGQMPTGLKMAKLRRWLRADIEAWLAAGCPVAKKQDSASQ